MIDPTGSVVVALIAAGLGVSFVSADRHSPTSWLLGVTFWCVGGSIFANVCLVHAQTESSIRALSVIAGIHEAGAMIGFHEWILRVRRTIPARGLRTTFGDRLSRFGEVAALVYLALAIWLPDVRAREFVGALQAEGALGRPAFYLFFVPSNLSILSGLLSIGLVLRRRPDPGERTRLLALCAAGPLLATGLILPLDWAPIAGALGEIVFLIGALRYHVFQGQRGQFLGRFLSPQVAEIVRSEGLAAVMRESTAELSVVACDLRGFTRLSEATSSQRVIQVLREYYDAVGGEAAELGGTIKDLAGDGILILVGAPLPYPDHARARCAWRNGSATRSKRD